MSAAEIELRNAKLILAAVLYKVGPIELSERELLDSVNLTLEESTGPECSLMGRAMAIRAVRP